jgi:ankyrin repeat protein
VTLLHVAAERGKDEMIKFLLSRGFKPDEICLSKGRDIKVTSLHLACYNGHAEAARLLMDAGANVNLSETDAQDKTDQILMQR